MHLGYDGFDSFLLKSNQDIFSFQSIPWSKNKEKQDKRKSKKEVRKTKAEKRKASALNEDSIVDDFDDDIRLMKKLKKGKVTQAFCAYKCIIQYFLHIFLDDYLYASLLLIFGSGGRTFHG